MPHVQTHLLLHIRYMLFRLQPPFNLRVLIALIAAVVVVLATGGWAHGQGPSDGPPPGLSMTPAAASAEMSTVADRHADSDQTAPQVTQNGSNDSHPLQVQHSQVANCAAGGCGLCGITKVPDMHSPPAAKVTWHHTSGALAEIAIAPPLRPPALQA